MGRRKAPAPAPVDPARIAAWAEVAKANKVPLGIAAGLGALWMIGATEERTVKVQTGTERVQVGTTERREVLGRKRVIVGERQVFEPQFKTFTTEPVYADVDDVRTFTDPIYEDRPVFKEAVVPGLGYTIGRGAAVLSTGLLMGVGEGLAKTLPDLSQTSSALQNAVFGDEIARKGRESGILHPLGPVTGGLIRLFQR